MLGGAVRSLGKPGPLSTKDQLENRFEPFLLPAWEDGPEFGRLLASFEAVLPLCEPSGLGGPAMRAHILRRSEGTIGEVAALLNIRSSFFQKGTLSYFHLSAVRLRRFSEAAMPQARRPRR